MCSVFHRLWVLPELLHCELLLTELSREAIGRLDEPMSSRAAGYLNSPNRAQLNQTTFCDSSNIIHSGGFIIVS